MKTAIRSWLFMSADGYMLRRAGLLLGMRGGVIAATGRRLVRAARVFLVADPVRIHARFDTARLPGRGGRFELSWHRPSLSPQEPAQADQCHHQGHVEIQPEAEEVLRRIDPDCFLEDPVAGVTSNVESEQSPRLDPPVMA